jgi:prepilin-type N-terminal cleavage/methylation domain-containing protein
MHVLNTAKNRRAFSLPELLAVVAILAVLATIIVVRATNGSSTSKSAACQTIKGDIEIQCELWMHNNGSWPTTNLSNIGADISYFPSGVPACPVDGSAYTIDTSGRVVGHNH